MLNFQGRIRKFGDNIDTDIIAPNKWMHEEMEILKQHAFETVRPNFHQQVTQGDILVVGRNFGYGSHREQANTVLKVFGISVIIADSMARIYFRNCIALGMPTVILPGISNYLNEDDKVAITLNQQGGSIKRDDGWEMQIPPLPDMFFKMIEQGGILPVLAKML